MTFEVDIQGQVEVDKAWVDLMKTAVFTTLTLEKAAPKSQLTLVLTDDATLQQLNRQFRHKDAPTDILSFRAESMTGMDNYLGDIVISIAYAQKHADEEGHSLAEELQLLAIHGTLHLLGYDDIDPKDKKKMWTAQTAVLSQIGLKIKVAKSPNK